MIGSHQEVYDKYLEQPEFHSMGRASKLTMYRAIHEVTKPESKFPIFEALCEYNENIKYKIKALRAANIKGIKASRMRVVSDTLCVADTPLADTNEKFCQLACYNRSCHNCGTEKLRQKIIKENIVVPNKQIFWQEWEKMGKKPHGEETMIPQKVELEGSVTDCIEQLACFPCNLE